ncbi:MAG: endonuclease domain-containing protein [Candidatus Nitronauta litoralis]|uniref:Endonuclease domain-containing protein n=1 Tax=Candidatus Nitronauta litoralis TaxID=2705533 RepID=A0A7T0BVA9_9BACT|nr:MAG: endonuclease domain-containing protein [Candidatus Nitronauta litoralis]
MKSPFNPSRTKKMRRALRNNMPPAEQALWKVLRGKKLKGYKFRRQFGVGEYSVDFFCPRVRLAIEVDGPSHFLESSKDTDDVRQLYIESTGVKILRFTNLDIRDNLDGVVQKILEHLE